MRRLRSSILFVALTTAVVFSFPPTALAEMGVGADARKPATEWAELLGGLDIARVEVNSDHVAIRLQQDCALVLAHETGSQCAGLFMDAGNSRACLKGTECPVWQDFQRSLSTAGAVFLPWREVAASTKQAEPEKQSAFREMTVPQRVRLYLAKSENEPAAAYLRQQLGEQDASLERLLAFVPAAWRVGAGPEAFGVLGQKPWLEASSVLTNLTRLTLLVGPRLALEATEALLTKDNACTAAPVITAFDVAGRAQVAFDLAKRIVTLDPGCFDAFNRGVMAAHQAGNTEGALVLYHEAAGRFQGMPKLLPLTLIALEMNEKWLALQTAAEPLLKPGVQPVVLAAWTRYLSQPKTQSRAVAAWTTVRDREPSNAWASYALGVVAHHQGRHQDAVTLLLKAAELEPTLGRFSRLYAMASLSTFALGDVERARALAQDATSRDPMDAFSHGCRGEVLREVEPLLAQKVLRTTMRLAPKRSPEGRLASKQLKAIRRCLSAEQPQGCEGPWRVTLP